MSWEKYFALGMGGTKNGSTYMKMPNMITDDELEDAMQFIAGSCMITPEMALNTIIKRDATDAEVEVFVTYLNDNECSECWNCGWYTHPGETCDCEDECTECNEIQAECTCE